VPNHECNLTKRVRTPQGLRFCPVVLSLNGRVKPDWVLVNGKEERHPDGAYYIEWLEGAKRIRVSVGKDAADANARASAVTPPSICRAASNCFIAEIDRNDYGPH
jgi:integrase/recombinase XerD